MAERMTWAKRQREAQITASLQRNGRVNRADLIDAFDVSPVTAAADLQGYLRRNPGWMRYDLSAKAYVPGPKFPALKS